MMSGAGVGLGFVASAVTWLSLGCGGGPSGLPDVVDDGADATGVDVADGSSADDAAADAPDAADAAAEVDADVDDGADGEVEVDADAVRRLFGVTVTDPWVAEEPGAGVLGTRLDGLVGAGGRRPAVRVVFDEGIDRVFRAGGLDAASYVAPVGNISTHALVMGELLDSLYVPDYDLAQYRSRACEYRATLGHLVDVWELGNEVNGEWLGDGVLEKLAAATEVFAADAAAFEAACPGFRLRADERPFERALTFYYNGPFAGGVATSDNCWSVASHAMERWVDDHFAAAGAVGTERIGPHLDLVLVSYYEDDCDGIQPDWTPVFEHLGAVFPAAALGFGECGTEDAASKVAYVERYYRGMDLPDPEYANMHLAHPRFVGGYFWWYFSEDLDDAAVYGALAGALGGPFWTGP